MGGSGGRCSGSGVDVRVGSSESGNRAGEEEEGWAQEEEDWRYVDQGEDDYGWVEELEEEARKKAAEDAEKAEDAGTKEWEQMQEMIGLA